MHTVLLIAEIGQLGLEAFVLVAFGASAVIFQHMQDPIDPALIFLEQDFEPFEFGFTAGRAFSPSRITTFLQALVFVN